MASVSILTLTVKSSMVCGKMVNSYNGSTHCHTRYSTNRIIMLIMTLRIRSRSLMDGMKPWRKLRVISSNQGLVQMIWTNSAAEITYFCIIICLE